MRSSQPTSFTIFFWVEVYTCSWREIKGHVDRRPVWLRSYTFFSSFSSSFDKYTCICRNGTSIEEIIVYPYTSYNCSRVHDPQVMRGWESGMDKEGIVWNHQWCRVASPLDVTSARCAWGNDNQQYVESSVEKTLVYPTKRRGGVSKEKAAIALRAEVGARDLKLGFDCG